MSFERGLSDFLECVIIGGIGHAGGAGGGGGARAPELDAPFAPTEDPASGFDEPEQDASEIAIIATTTQRIGSANDWAATDKRAPAQGFSVVSKGRPQSFLANFTIKCLIKIARRHSDYSIPTG
jgi:hypothetical protein